MKAATTVEFEADGWWASCKFGDDTVLGHGSSREAALEDLERQVEGFVNFLKRTGQPIPESLE
jgi:predicted RNase H-like HicB family nuclease